MNAEQRTAEAKGRFGPYGGQYVPETLMNALLELETAYRQLGTDQPFWADYTTYLEQYSGRPTPLYYAANLSKHVGRGCRVYLKREDLNHTGAHKLNNVIGQILLARRMGKTRIIAETGAGQHGVATATVAAMFGLPCEVFMGEEDVKRQALNVFKMRLLGAQVHSVSSGTATLKDAANEAIRDWVAHVDETFYVIGSVIGPHPYPSMVRDFQRIIGEETRRQIQAAEGRMPDVVLACVGGGSNAIGIFHPFLADAHVRLIGVEAAGLGLDTEQHAATLSKGRRGVLHGMMTCLLQDDEGQVLPAHSVSAGLDYPGVGPEHAYLKDTGRASYAAVTDQQALAAFQLLSRREGIIPALESAHALAYLDVLGRELPPESLIVVNLSGRGDKDVSSVADVLQDSDFQSAAKGLEGGLDYA